IKHSLSAMPWRCSSTLTCKPQPPWTPRNPLTRRSEPRLSGLQHDPTGQRLAHELPPITTEVPPRKLSASLFQDVQIAPFCLAAFTTVPLSFFTLRTKTL